MSNSYIAYVDGSYKEGLVGWSFVVLVNKNEMVFDDNGSTKIFNAQMNVTGECIAVMKLLNWLEKNSINKVEIFYDYEGLLNWIDGSWKAKKELSAFYRNFVLQKMSNGMNITWTKVESHSGNYWNDHVDKLAKESVGA